MSGYTDMTSREIITRVLEHRDAPRIGLDFVKPHFSDFVHAGRGFFRAEGGKYDKWDRYPELIAKVPNFRGEVRLDPMGNIRGRLDPTSMGEPICGIFQEGWDGLEEFEFPEFEAEYMEKLRSRNYQDSDKFVLVGPPVNLFSALRAARGMDNALADTIMEPELLTCFLEKGQRMLLRVVEAAYEIGAQGLMLADDWGMQHAPFIRTESFCELFKPVYKNICDAAHERGLKVLLHSCGNVWDYMPHFIEAGIDAMQFDQPELSGSENLAREFGKQITIYSPVDIQQIMPTGDKELIEASARHMIKVFKENGGTLIAKDYPSWRDIYVKEEWAEWARQIFMKEGWNN